MGIRKMVCIGAVLALVAAASAKQSAWVAPADSNVPGAASAAVADAPVARNGSRPLAPPVRVRLVGEVIGLAVSASAPQFTLTVGGQPVPVASTGRSYSADFIAAPDAMVVVEARSTRVLYRSFLGSAALLNGRGGADELTGPTEHSELVLSPWTTAVAFLGARSLGGRAPASDDELQLMRRGLGSHSGWEVFSSSSVNTDAASIAHVLEEVAGGRIALPDRFTTGLDLVGDVLEYKKVLQPAVRAAARDYPLRTGARSPVGSLAELPARLLLGSQVPVTGMATTARSTMLLTKVATARFRVALSQIYMPPLGQVQAPYSHPEYIAELTSEGDVVLTPDGSAFTDVSADNGPTRLHFRRILLRRLAAGDAVGIWASAIDWTEEPLSGASAPRERTQVAVWWGSNLQALVRRIDWAQHSRHVVLPRFCMEASTAAPDRKALSLCEFAQHRFDAGGYGATVDTGSKINSGMRPSVGVAGPPFFWSQQDPGTRMRVVSGDVTVDYWLIDDRDTVGDLVAYEAFNHAGTDPGQRVSGVQLVVPGAGIELDAPQVTGHMKLPNDVFDLSYPENYAPGFYVRRADGTSDEFLDPEGLAGTSIPSRWEVANSRLFDIRYRARFGTGSRYVSSCEEAFSSGASACAPWRVRYFRPIARVGNRLYGYTEFYFQTTFYPPGYIGPYTVSRGGGGPVYYECTSGECLNFGASP